MSSQDLFRLADENSESLEVRVKTLSSTGILHDTAVLEQFKLFIELNWTICINMRDTGIQRFLVSGEVFNLYQLIELEIDRLNASGQILTEEQALRSHLKSFYDRRILFDRSFKDGRMFRYGALYLGGLGVTHYGNCCVVFRKDKIRNYASVAFLLTDSLAFVPQTLDMRKLSESIANKKSVNLLASLKHGKHITPETQIWSSLVCSEKEYIEAITTDQILREHVEKVIMSKKDYDSNMDLLFKLFSSQNSLTEFDRYRLNSFRILLDLLKVNKISLELIPDGI